MKQIVSLVHVLTIPNKYLHYFKKSEPKSISSQFILKGDNFEIYD